MSEWQTIENAPKDFERYLFYCANGVMRVDRYNKHYGKTTGLRWQEAPINKYTHWMRLPEEPTTPTTE